MTCILACTVCGLYNLMADNLGRPTQHRLPLSVLTSRLKKVGQCLRGVKMLTAFKVFTSIHVGIRKLTVSSRHAHVWIRRKSVEVRQSNHRIHLVRAVLSTAANSPSECRHHPIYPPRICILYNGPIFGFSKDPSRVCSTSDLLAVYLHPIYIYISDPPPGS